MRRRLIRLTVDMYMDADVVDDMQAKAATISLLKASEPTMNKLGITKWQLQNIKTRKMPETKQ